MPELLFTFGLSYVIVEVVQLIWGRAAVRYPIPAEVDGPLFTLYTTTFPMYRGFMLVFGGGCALAVLAGVIGGNAFVTEPGMAATVGSIIFVVVVVGGMGSLAGAFVASLALGLVQTFAVALDYSFVTLFAKGGIVLTPGSFGYPLLRLTIAQVAPIMPYLLLVLILTFRP